VTSLEHGDTVELLQSLIRNECVNDGTPESGGERSNADLLRAYLEGAGLDLEQFTSQGDRTSIVARIEGSDPSAPKLCLMGHTDVVPVNPAGWSRDPFGGELIDGEVWGRGALDMLCVTSSMAVAFRELARSGWRPKGDLIYFGVADEEAGGEWGAKWMVEHHWDAIACDYLLTELGGFRGGDGRSIAITTAEKGVAWRRLTITGTPGHGSSPYRSDNAVLKAAKIVQRISEYCSSPQLDDLWVEQVRTSGLGDDVQEQLLDPARLADTLDSLPVPQARGLHASAHTTMSCNVVHGGQKTNVIPDRVQLDVDVRTLPGVTGDAIDHLLGEILGELAPDVQIESLVDDVSTRSTLHSPLWDALRSRIQHQFPNSEISPRQSPGATDARFFRQKGVVAYGAALFSPSVDIRAVGARFHGNDERIDVESLQLSTQFWYDLAGDLLS
jgi:acetylornithine deacetylase/succinyl-diaminopimelate desuccinylase-like protein